MGGHVGGVSQSHLGFKTFTWWFLARAAQNVLICYATEAEAILFYCVKINRASVSRSGPHPDSWGLCPLLSASRSGPAPPAALGGSASRLGPPTSAQV
jgi:hypothetical protein